MNNDEDIRYATEMDAEQRIAGTMRHFMAEVDELDKISHLLCTKDLEDISLAKAKIERMLIRSYSTIRRIRKETAA